jgi:hypothetical protein
MKTTQIKKKSHKKYFLIPLIIYAFAFLFVHFFMDNLYEESIPDIVKVQKNKIKYYSDNKDKKSFKFLLYLFNFINCNQFYLALCCVLSNFMNTYKIFTLSLCVYFSNFISSTLSFIYHSPRPYMVYKIIKTFTIFHDWGNPNSQLMTLYTFSITLYYIIFFKSLKTKKMIELKIILGLVFVLYLILDTYYFFVSGEITYGQIFNTALLSIATYFLIVNLFKINVNNYKQFFSIIHFKFFYYLILNVLLFTFEIILYNFVTNKEYENYFKNNIKKQLEYDNEQNFVVKGQKTFYLNNGVLVNVIVFTMNLFAILSLKLEYILIYKKTFENWTKFNFEINEREYSKLSLNYYGDLKFVEGYQWNHTNWKKNLIRTILSIVFCIICLSPMSIIFTSDNQVLILVVGIALPSILITIGTFFFNKLIFKSFGLTKIAEYKMINNNEN